MIWRPRRGCGLNFLRMALRLFLVLKPFRLKAINIIHTQRKIMTASTLDWAFEPFLTAPMISLAMQLNCEMVSKGNLKPCFKIKSEVPGALYLDHIAAGNHTHFQSTCPCSKLPHPYTKIRYKGCSSNQDLFEDMYKRTLSFHRGFFKSKQTPYTHTKISTKQKNP